MEDKQKSNYSRTSMRMGERVKEFLPPEGETASDTNSSTKAVKRELTGKATSEIPHKKSA